MQDLGDTIAFVKVVEEGSFTKAALRLRLPKTTLSRKVRDLERRLGIPLLHRTTRRIGLTEAGTVYFERCRRIAEELEQADCRGSLGLGLRVEATLAHGRLQQIIEIHPAAVTGRGENMRQALRHRYWLHTHDWPKTPRFVPATTQ